MYEKPVAKPATHDLVNPPALLDFMLQRWKPRPSKLPPRVQGHARFRARRAALSAAFPGDVLIVPTGHEKVRANDTYYPFRAGSDFYYLTGNLEPDCVLVLWPKAAGGHEHVLYVEPHPGRQDATFYTDRKKGELWTGPRLGVPESAHRYQVDRAAPLSELMESATTLPREGIPWRLLRGFSPELEGLLPGDLERDKALAATLSEARLIKDSLELAALQRACAATRRGFEDVIRSLKKATSERQVEATFDYRARVEGNAVGYGTIAAAGPHACILHWQRNDGPLKRDELLLLDAGVESHELYTADVTRTLPVGGRFTKTQRQIYDLVLAAQTAAFAEVKPGNDFLAPHRAAMQVLARGLETLGILPTTAEVALRNENQFYKRYSLHGVSHMLGLDVHDCAQARQEVYKYGALRPGMVLTVEPGLYFQLDDLTVPARYRGIGIRIEDDVVVTKRGCRILSDLPRRADDVERWMRSLWKKR